jgi:hypothetical protein
MNWKAFARKWSLPDVMTIRKFSGRVLKENCNEPEVEIRSSGLPNVSVEHAD